MSSYFELFPRGWTPSGWTSIGLPEVCFVCDKSFPRQYAICWNGTNYEQLPMLNGAVLSPDVAHDVFCQGHISVECPECGWMVPQGYHTEEECQRLGQICGKKKRKTEVPQAFYKAFEEEEA